MKLFPYVLTRYSGGSFNDFESLKIKDTHQLVHQIHDFKQELKAIKNKISDAIHPLIPSFNEKPEIQKQLINLRRDVFNERNIKDDKIKLAEEVLAPEIIADIQEYIGLYIQLEGLVKHGANIYENELRESRLRLKKIIGNPDFQKGLILSSRSILDQLNKYLEKDPNDYRKKEIQIEQGMMKYISRMYCKTSPFSTFTNLSAGKIKPLNNPSSIIDHEKSETNFELKSHIRINNYLYHFTRGLLLKNKDIYCWFLVRLNPTVQKTEETYLFLTNSNNVEAFQRIPFSPVLDFFIELISEQTEGIVYNDLLSALLENIEASSEELQAYINQLIEYGFLEFNIGVSGTDPDWDITLQNKLHYAFEKNAPHIKELTATLASVRNLARQYEIGSVQERQQLQQEAYNQLRAICMQLHEAAGLPADERKTQDVLIAEAKQKREAFEQEQKLAKEKEAENAEKKEQEIKAEPKEEIKNLNTTEQPTENTIDDEQVIFKHQASTYFYFKPEQMFYEDTTVEVAPLFNTSDTETLMAKFYKLISTYKSFEHTFDEREKMAQFFANKYGKKTKIDLLTFYEDFYRDYKKKELEDINKAQQEQRKKAEEAIEKLKIKNEELKIGESKQDENAKREDVKTENIEPIKIVAARIKLRQEMNAKWLEAFVSVCKEKIEWNNDEINIKANLFDEATANVPIHLYDNPKSSYAAFMMPFIKSDADGNKKLMMVINSSFPGYGKLFTRFLHILEPNVTDTIRKWNAEINQGYISAEDTDASFFNANLHPPLLPYEMWIPNGNNSLPAEQQIPITDVEVIFNHSTEQLTLIHKKLQKEIKIFDLCFQGINGRSQLFQLLEKFSSSRYPIWMNVTMTINNSKPQEENVDNTKPRVWQWPRIVFEDQLILKRKSWFVPKALLPIRQPNDNNWLYFERVNLWRLEHRIPKEVFIYIVNRNELDVLPPSQRKNLNRDDYKPQYISFENPFMVHLFEKLIEKVPTNLRIEEMLPGAENLLEVNGQKRITELLVQIYE